MEKENQLVADRILNLTLEIIYMLTGEYYGPVKKEATDQMTPSSHSCVSGGWKWSQSPIMEPPPSFLSAERNKYKKILEVTSKTAELLTGEVPMRCQDVGASQGPVGNAERCEAEASYSGVGNSADEFDSRTPQGTLAATSNHMSEGELLITINGRAVPTTMANVGGFAKDECDQLVSVQDGHTVGNIHDKHGYPTLYTRKGLVPEESGNAAAVYTEEMADVSGILASSDDGLASVCTPQTQYQDTLRVEEGMATAEDEAHLPIMPITKKEEEDLYQNFNAQANTSCPEFSKQFSCQSSLARHQRIHTGLKPFACFECGRCFNRMENLAAHARIHRREKPFACHCGRVFLRKESLVLHRRRHSGEKPYSCAECGKSFTNVSDLGQHKRLHSDQKLFLCSECGRCFVNKGDLCRHQKVHQEKIYPCPQCPRSFAVNSDLLRHMRHHLIPRVTLLCPECGKQFPSKSQLARHRIIHSGEKPFQCSECGRCFNRASNLDAHIKTHVGEKPFPCAECGKRFLWKSQLTIHQRTHTGEKPYTCTECGWQFASNSNLVKHRRLHTGERPYSCPDCGRCFTNKSDLTKHQKTHTAETPFVCAERDECFANNAALLRHQMIHSQGAGCS